MLEGAKLVLNHLQLGNLGFCIEKTMFFVDGFAKKLFLFFLCTLLFCVELRLISKSLYFVLFWKHFFCFYGRDCFLCFSREFVGWWSTRTTE